MRPPSGGGDGPAGCIGLIVNALSPGGEIGTLFGCIARRRRRGGPVAAMERSKHILLVDDEAEFVFSAEIALRGAGYAVTVASSGGEALDMVGALAASGNAVDLLVSDIQMVGMSGTELIGAARERWPSLPVFVMTGQLDDDAGGGLAAGGCAGYILKPFNPREFLGRIAEALGPGSRREERRQGG